MLWQWPRARNLSLRFVYTRACICSYNRMHTHVTTPNSQRLLIQAFYRGLLCNWLVTMGVWMATNSSDIASKALAIFLPISAFVALGCVKPLSPSLHAFLNVITLHSNTSSPIKSRRLDHSVANMFMIPFGMVWHIFTLAKHSLSKQKRRSAPTRAHESTLISTQMNGADISIRQFLCGNLLPVTLGNIIGGAGAVAGLYKLSFGSKE